jgi:hypothetical protein
MARTCLWAQVCAAAWVGATTLSLGPAAWASKSEPAPQWALEAAKTPTPADAAQAAAVLLSDEYLITVDEQNHAVARERFVVRILKPQGRRYARCEAEYDADEKLDSFHSWTITADGRQFEAKDTDFKDVGAYDSADLQFSDRFRILNPPGADPGAVVVCETESHLRPYMDSEDWQIQSSIPVVHEALELALPPGGHYSESWSRFTPVKPEEVGPERLRWELDDVPALDLENMHATPPWEALAARMEVKWGDEAVKGAADQWRSIGRWMEQLEEHRTDPTPEIRAAAQQLVAGAPDLYTKLSRITSYIQKNVRYFIVIKGIGGWQAHYAGDIFHNRYGDCKDKATLLIAMLEAVGVKAYYLHVDSERGVIDPAAPSLIGNHMITAIELPAGENDPRLMARVKTADGKTLLIFDPTDQETPVGLIRMQLQGAYGNLAEGENSQVLEMPVLPPEAAGVERQGSFVLAADGSLSGDVTDVFTGDEAARERAMMQESDAKGVHDRLETSLDADLPGLAFKGYAFKGTDDLDKPLELELHLSDANYAHAAGPLILLRTRVLGSDARVVPDAAECAKRKFPIELGRPGHWRDSFAITLPPGYVVDEAPDPVNMDVGFASYRSSVSAKGNILHYDREYVVRQVEIPASQGGDYRKLEGAIVEDEQGTAVLKKQ